jgi:streptogramin lyase
MGGYGTLMWVSGETYLSFNMLGMDPSEGEDFALELAPVAMERLPAAFTVSTTGEFGGGFTFEYSSGGEAQQPAMPEAEPLPSGPPAVWVNTTYGGTITHIDPQTNSVVSRIEIGEGLHDIVAGLDYLFVSHGDRSSLIWIDPILETIVQEIPIESSTHLKLSLDAEYLYIGAPRWGTLEVRHRSTGELIERMTYTNAWDVEVSEYGLWFTNGPEQEFIVDLNIGSWDEDTLFEPGGAISYIKYYKGHYWLGVRQEVHKVLKVNPSTHEIVAEIVIDAGEQYMSAMGVGEGGVWVGFSQGMLVKVDPQTGMEVLRVWGLDNPVSIAGGYGGVWVSYIAEDAVARLDPETLDPVAVISVDKAPYAIALNP